MRIDFDLNKTLEQLEKDYWGEPEHHSKLVITFHRLRKKPISDFEVEDLRIMIGQNIGLEFLLPVAIKVLEKSILAEGDFYEGDLLTQVLQSDRDYWLHNRQHWKTICRIFKENQERLENFDIIEEIRENWFELYLKFKYFFPA